MPKQHPIGCNPRTFGPPGPGSTPLICRDFRQFSRRLRCLKIVVSPVRVRVSPSLLPLCAALPGFRSEVFACSIGPRIGPWPNSRAWRRRQIPLWGGEFEIQRLDFRPVCGSVSIDSLRPWRRDGSRRPLAQDQAVPGDMRRQERRVATRSRLPSGSTSSHSRPASPSSSTAIPNSSATASMSSR
jgi:hypothetical protein